MSFDMKPKFEIECPVFGHVHLIDSEMKLFLSYKNNQTNNCINATKEEVEDLMFSINWKGVKLKRMNEFVELLSLKKKYHAELVLITEIFFVYTEKRG